MATYLLATIFPDLLRKAGVLPQDGHKIPLLLLLMIGVMGAGAATNGVTRTQLNGIICDLLGALGIAICLLLGGLVATLCGR